MTAPIKLCWVLLAALLWPACAGSHGREGSLIDAAIVDDASADASVADASVADAALDAQAPSCEADAVELNACIAGEECVESGLHYWNGDACLPWPGCFLCNGEDCDALGTLEQCRAAHAACEPELCRDTGGTWRVEHAYCGHFTCGVEPEACPPGGPACDCGLGKIFHATRGCIESDACTARELCIATHGQWRNACLGPCDVEVFDPEGGACEETCVCGTGFRFDDARGCVPRETDECPGASEQQLCERSGGAWSPICAHAECGTSLLPCTALACDCGPFGIFDPARGGCVRSDDCVRPRMLGETCGLPNGLECGSGLVCCSNGIGTSACELPVCSEHGPCGPPRP